MLSKLPLDVWDVSLGLSDLAKARLELTKAQANLQLQALCSARQEVSKLNLNRTKIERVDLRQRRLQAHFGGLVPQRQRQVRISSSNKLFFHLLQKLTTLSRERGLKLETAKNLVKVAGRGIRLLCLDGGGVRGLSSLHILKKLMETIDPGRPPKPCEYFDMIGGTSTGGYVLLAL